MQDVGGVGPDVGSEEIGDGRIADFFEVILEVCLGVAPCEVGIGLGEAAFGERIHDVGASEGFGEEDCFWRVFEDFSNAPLPEGESFGVRIIDAEDAYAAIDPELEDAVESVPEAAPVVGFEVERIDVLVFLGWILSVLDRAVRTVREPGGMLVDPGMIGGTLEGDVQGDVERVRFCGCYKLVEVVERAELRMNGSVAAEGGADGPGASVISGRGLDRVVGTFAKGVSDGMNGRHVEHVKAHGGDSGHARFDVVEGAVLAGYGGGRAGEKFIPAGEAGAVAVDPERELDVVTCSEFEVRIFCVEEDEFGSDGVVVDGEVGVGERAKVCGGELQLLCVGTFGARSRGIEMISSDA